MFKINGEDIETKYMLEVASEGDTRERAYLNHKYIKPFFESTKIQIPEFKNNGTPMTFCTKGGRPSFTEVISYAPAPPPSEDVQEWNIVFSKPDTKTPTTNFLSVWSTNNGETTESASTCYIIEMVAGGGGGTGGGAILAGVGGGAGAYAVIMVNTEELPYNESGGTYSYAKVRVRIKPLNDSPSSSDYGGIGASNRGSATSGRDVEVVYEESGKEKIVITCRGGKGANAGDVGSGGTINISDDLPEAISVLYYTNGLSANGGVSASTITCPQNTLIVGFENEGDEYKLTRGGFNGVTEGGGASSGAPSQFGNGGIEGKTNNGYDGGDADINANGAGGGGGHGKAFSQSNGGNGGRPKIIVYTEPIEPITFSNASWTEIDNIASVGKASVFFSVGDEKTITLSTGEKITLVILGFDHDDLSNSSGKAKITIGMKNLLTTEYKMESSSTCWGWDRSYMRNYTMPALFLELPADLQKVIKPVNKRAMEGLGSTDIVISSDKLWLLAEAEIEEKDNTSPYLAEGEQYEYWRSVKDGNNYKDRIKYLSNDESRASSWWLRSCDTLFKNQYSIVDPQGHMSSSSPSSDTRISYCFCV
ncbi:MAG TPA: hypothetical protein H9677_05650 [Firmicutes bacterium]|nr:hypothetical protein [Bacillota bacterium]